MIIYAGLVFALTVPFWVLGFVVDSQVLPGLPVSALAVVCPTLAAIILTLRSGGRPALTRFISQLAGSRLLDGRWIAVALLNPALFALAYSIARTTGVEFPEPRFSAAHALTLFALFLPSALLEEMGWTGCAFHRLRSRMSLLWSGATVGVVSAVWHVPSLLMVDRNLEWIAWWGLWTLSARLIMVWLYERGRAGLIGVVLYHTMSNLCWQLYPIDGSYFDPRMSGLITLGLAMVLFLYKDGGGRPSPAA